MRLDSLSARLAATLAVFGIATVVALGATTFVVLRGLHQTAEQSRVVDLVDSALPQVRASAVQGDLRGALVDLRDVLAARGVTAWLLTADGRLHGSDGQVPSVDPPVALRSTVRGTTTSGIATIDGGRSVYAATVLGTTATGQPRALVFSAADTAARDALADLLRAIPFVLLVALIVGGLLGWALVRSVGGPLRRLAHATAHVPAAGASPLPVEGPDEVRELTGRFNTMLVELETTRRREQELLADVRHDLRTPLTVIGGFARALEDGTASGEAAGSAARAIVEETDRLERLVATLGDLDRLRAGDDGLRPEPLDARALVEETAARFGGPAGAEGIELRVTAAGESARPLGLAADRSAVERILANLIANAMAAVARPGGSIVLSADAAIGPDGRDAVVFRVTDDGPGFPTDDLSRVFDRFYRGDRARSGSGSGLGLAIVRELARAHGGDAWAEDVSPRGARVTVLLPAMPTGMGPG